VVWSALGADPRAVSARSAAQRLDQAGQASHLVWNPLNGEIVQLIPIVRAGRSLGIPAHEVNREGRVCVQISVVACAHEPFTDGPLARLPEILTWLDSWGIARSWPAAQPALCPSCQVSQRSRRLWARGGHFGESQVPGLTAAGPGAIDIERLTGWSAVHAARVPIRHAHEEYEPAALGELLGEKVASAASLARVR
jgi:hypothetical protein